MLLTVEAPAVAVQPDRRRKATSTRKLLEGEWDLGVIVTDLPLKVGGRPVSRHVSPTHGLAVLSLPALGPVHLRQRLRRALVELIGELTGGRSSDAWEDSVLRELTTDTARHPGGLGLLYGPALVASHLLRLLLGMVRANRPWGLAARLYGALVAALAVGAYGVVTSDVWQLAGSTGWWRLLIICVVSITGTVAAIIGAHGLWERLVQASPAFSPASSTRLWPSGVRMMAISTS